MNYTFTFEEPLDVVTFNTRTIYDALYKLAEYMVANKRRLCNLAPYYQTSKRSFLLKEHHIKFIQMELLS